MAMPQVPQATMETPNGPNGSGSNQDGAYCPYFHHAVELIGRRWTGVVLLVLSRSPQRYSRLREQIPGLSDRLLTERLNELEGEGIVERCGKQSVTVYRLTDFGQQLVPVIDAIESFAHVAAARIGAVERPGRNRA